MIAGTIAVHGNGLIGDDFLSIFYIIFVVGGQSRSTCRRLNNLLA